MPLLLCHTYHCGSGRQKQTGGVCNQYQFSSCPIVQTKYPKEIDVFYSNKEIKDINELKLRTFTWRKAGTIRLEKNQPKASLDLSVPVTCSNLKLHFESLYEDLQLMANETLLCPSCSQVPCDPV